MVKKCSTCQASEITDTTVRAWYCTPQDSNQATIQWLCLTDAAALERSGWTVTIVPTTRQRKIARQWDAAGIGAN